MAEVEYPPETFFMHFSPPHLIILLRRCLPSPVKTTTAESSSLSSGLTSHRAFNEGPQRFIALHISNSTPLLHCLLIYASTLCHLYILSMCISCHGPTNDASAWDTCYPALPWQRQCKLKIGREHRGDSLWLSILEENRSLALSHSHSLFMSTLKQ